MTKFSELKTGEVLSETQFYTVEKIVGDKVQLKNDNGENVIVNNKYVENMLNSSQQVTSTEKLTRTELTEKFLSHPRIAMTVNFNKQVKPTDIKKEIVNLYPNKGGKLMSESDFKKHVSKALNLKGEERTMVGRHYGEQDANGRVPFIDMQVTTGIRQRLVDPRTLNWMIVNGVRYEVK